MRVRHEAQGLSVHAVAGSYVVLLGLDCTADALPGLLGFAIERTDHVEDERYWLRSFKIFEATGGGVRPGMLVSTREHPLQTFMWSDFTTKPGYRYTYRVVALYGKPKNLRIGRAVEVEVTTERVDEGTHAIHFNRGVAASQAYARKFGNLAPDKVDPRKKVWAWLSRGLEEAMLGFIAKASGPRFALRVAVYEFSYSAVLQALRAALDRGVDLKIIYDRRGKAAPGGDPKVWEVSEPAAQAAGLGPPVMIRRQTNSAIAHNKTMVLLEDGVPIEVWTGSTNLTRGGIFGQANVGHVVRDPAVAASYLAAWQRLAEDPDYARIRPANSTATADPAGPPTVGTTSVFSPRQGEGLLDWYAERIRAAQGLVCLTAAFGVERRLAEALGEEADHLRYLLLEREDGDAPRVYRQDEDTKVAVGSYFGEGLWGRWLKERLTGLNSHVRYAHTKFMLIDPLGADPLVVTGSGNFSVASITRNDENMLLIRGEPRVADVYLGEFMRVFNHYYVRSLEHRVGLGESSALFLRPDDGWTARAFQPGTASFKQRLLFR